MPGFLSAAPEDRMAVNNGNVKSSAAGNGTSCAKQAEGVVTLAVGFGTRLEMIASRSTQRWHWRRLLALFFALIVLPLLQSCSAPERLPPVPTAETGKALPLGLANARFFPLLGRDAIIDEWELALQRQRVALGLAPDAQLPEAHYLAISGGGDNGAFGSGILVGWTEAGSRPEFQVVTGVSTGALIAPFAFLGPEYDPQLRAVYTTISAEDVYSERGFISGIFGDAMADTTPLFNLISSYVDDSLLAAIAREYKKGRLLLIGTTDLDAERANIWNIGAIAASGDPGAIDLIRRILRASSAVPGFFQPVMIDVELDGKQYQELHVDGGAIAQMFLYPPSIDITKLAHRSRTAYLIRNAREDPEWQSVERQTLSIAGRAVSTMIHTSGSNDLLRIYYTCQRDGVDYNLAYIGSDFSHPEAGDFDKAYMNALFDYAYQQARHGYPWQKVPPILANVEQ
jgi:predicted patatin/cPLA2 family phospholipase